MTYIAQIYIKSCIFAWIIRAQMSGRHRILPNRIFHIEFVWNKIITLIQNNTLWHPLTYTSTPRLFVFSKIIRCNRIWKAGLTTQGFLSSQVYWNPLQAGITPPLQTKFHRTGRGLDRRFIPTRELWPAWTMIVAEKLLSLGPYNTRKLKKSPEGFILHIV